jgi:hypothetical protein
MDLYASRIKVVVKFFSNDLNMVEDEIIFGQELDKVSFQNEMWEYEFWNERIWLFLCKDGKIYRTMIYYQKYLEYYTGEIRRRLYHGVYEILATFQGIGVKSSKSLLGKSQKVITDLFQGALEEMRQDTPSKKLDEFVSKRLEEEREKDQKKCEVKRTQVLIPVDETWEDLFGRIGISKVYVKIFKIIIWRLEMPVT